MIIVRSCTSRALMGDPIQSQRAGSPALALAWMPSVTT